MSFTDFNLQKDFIASIEASGYQSPTPLQSQLIPLVEEQKSALVLSQSAAGKTGAFLIPAINYILENPAPEKRGARILILTSRRDRVSQINYTIKRLSRDHNMRFGFIVSGRPYQTQMRLMRRPLDIMIATPGRLNDLMENKKADFSQLEMLIIDDLSSIYQKNLHGLVEKILQQAKQDIPSLTFVNNDNDEIINFAHKIFPNATTILIDDNSDSSNNDFNEPHGTDNPPSKSPMKKPREHSRKEITPAIDPESLMPQIVHVADDYTHKIALMDHLLDEFEGESTIIYTSTPKVAKTLQENLTNHGHTAELLHDLSSEELTEEDLNTLIICDQDDEQKIKKLVDNPSTHLIHFDLPYKTPNFIKRLGNHHLKREDAAILIVDGRNYNELKQIEKSIGTTLKQVTVPGLEPLLPFVNKSKPQNRNQNKSKLNTKQKNTRNQPRKTSTRNKNNKNSNNEENKSRRQRKGPFGRLNGGVHRKQSDNENQNTRPKNKNKSNAKNNNANTQKRNNHQNKKNRRQVGLSPRGTNAPTSDRAWQSDFAEPKERKAPTKRVVIRYKDKKRLLPENANDESS